MYVYECKDRYLLISKRLVIIRRSNTANRRCHTHTQLMIFFSITLEFNLTFMHERCCLCSMHLYVPCISESMRTTTTTTITSNVVSSFILFVCSLLLKHFSLANSSAIAFFLPFTLFQHFVFLALNALIFPFSLSPSLSFTN